MHMTEDNDVDETVEVETGKTLELRSAELPGMQDLKEKVRNRRKEVGAAAGLLLVATFVSMAFLLGGTPGEISEEKGLTTYQKQYVDCPRKYLETCTAMSKLPTEPVTYWKTENGKLYLKLEDGRAIVATLPTDTAAGEFVTYMSAAEVREATTGKTSQESSGNSTS